jgi:tetratricopeptide (TPR) repeat protein
MDFHKDLSVLPLSQRTDGEVIILEAPSGQNRHRYLQEQLKTAQKNSASTWLLTCDFKEEGPWAGLKDLLNDLIPKIQSEAPDLLIKHDYELANVLPSLQKTISVRNPNLTDISQQHERTRNYPADRALRIIHGLINLLTSWKQLQPNTSWIIACDRFDQASALVRYFFIELMRRRGQSLHLTLIVASSLEGGKDIAAAFGIDYDNQCVRLNLHLEENPSPSPQAMAQIALELEQQIGQDYLELEAHLPRLIRYWQLSHQPEKALTYKIEACSIYTTRGFYEDALVYGEAALSQLEHDCPEDFSQRWVISVKLYNCYAALDRPVEALEAVEAAMAKTSNPDHRFRGCYMLSLMHARFLPELNFSKAEDYLEQSLEYLLQAQLPEATTIFHTAFNQNALALIRHRQGKPKEAAELCKFWFEQLNERLPLNEHHLHRSVLLYNIAQVYTSIGSNEEAIFFLSKAMSMDPNYSEYYNDRGNLYLKLGRLQEAMNDYLQAIELSPPYWEVWSNLGRCYRLMDRMTESVNAYSICLDLDPNQISVFVARAQILEILGQVDAALIDYTRALELNANQPLVLANRAILHYDAERYREALTDLNQAISLDPENPDLYQNRAVALITLQFFQEAMNDLNKYLELSPFADDRSEVENQLLSLQLSTIT